MFTVHVTPDIVRLQRTISRRHPNMSQAMQEIPAEEHNGYRNTGFPEPLSLERNTTLPHPDADTSPTASIEAADISLARSSSRLGSRFHRKHAVKRSGSLGLAGMMYRDVLYEDGTTGTELQEDVEGLEKQSSAESDGGVGKASDEREEERSGSNYRMGDEGSLRGKKEGEKKKMGFLRRSRSQKH